MKKKQESYIPDRLDVNSFNCIYAGWGRKKQYCNYSPEYLSDIDYNKLIQYIELFMAFTRGEFGYFEQGSWHNHKEINSLVSSIPLKLNIKWDMFDICDGPEINIEILLCFGRYQAIPFEYYRINFYYNSHENKNCQLRIHGCYNDFSFEDKVQIHNICDYKRDGSYLELLNELKCFFETMNEINENIISEATEFE